jgi:Cu(I)/Ag(I) efflux system membrane fusion protein
LAGESSVVYVETDPGRFEIRPVKIGPILRDKIVILAGLSPGESVATAGNFLIDSQMQLSGKPSLIDSTRALGKGKQRAGPLIFEQIAVTPIGGDAGQKLEELYAAYLEVQRALAADSQPPAVAAEALYAAANELAGHAALPDSTTRYLHEIAVKSEHLPQLDLAAARREFRPISHAVVALATQVRSGAADTRFTHYFCPMVAGGGGDWLQAGGDLRNPYFGSEMPRCGEKVRELPAAGDATGNGPGLPTPDPGQPTTEEEQEKG